MISRSRSRRRLSLGAWPGRVGASEDFSAEDAEAAQRSRRGDGLSIPSRPPRSLCVLCAEHLNEPLAASAVWGSIVVKQQERTMFSEETNQRLIRGGLGMPMRALPALVLSIALLATIGSPAVAEAYPDHPIRLIVPGAAGGPTRRDGARGRRRARFGARPAHRDRQPDRRRWRRRRRRGRARRARRLQPALRQQQHPGDQPGRSTRPCRTIPRRRSRRSRWSRWRR